VNNEIQIEFLGKDFHLSRPKLKDWFSLEDIRTNIYKTAEAQDIDKFSENVCSYVSAVIGISLDDVLDAPGYEVIEAYLISVDVNSPKIELPLLKSAEKSKETPWDYEHRSWYLWSHKFASNYGWTLDYIAEMDVDDALALMQEIIVEDQLDREWNWSLSEIAYPYNAQTKKTEFKALPRPDWMSYDEKKTRQALRKVKIHKSMMPAGIIKTHENKNITSKESNPSI